jgi:hypothetical protein
MPGKIEIEKSKINRRRNGGQTAADRRPTSGESAAEEKNKISRRSGARLVLASRSFLMKAD